MTDHAPLDVDELMNMAERIERLPPVDAEWVGRLFQECLRARMCEGELLAAGNDPVPSAGHRDGELLEAQLAQVALDAAEWLKTLWNVGYMGAGSFPAQPRSAFPLIELEDVLKSALFARIREGKRPLPFPPPTRHGRPWHQLVESRTETFEVDAEIVHDPQEQVIGAIIEACPDWHVVETVERQKNYLVQHRLKGPLFHLCFAAEAATLRRAAPRWTRRLRYQERAGFHSFMLDWPQDDDRTRAIPLRAATWERAEAEAAHWIASQHPEMYGQVRFERVEE